jgi:nicotinamide phosphoribosyltransferase
MTDKNLILTTDSYKASHWLQYPNGTEYINSYIEPRYSNLATSVVNFGLQMFLLEYLSKPITPAMIEEAEYIFGLHGEPFNKAGWQYIIDKHGGYIPVRIQAVPEGFVLPLSNVQVQVRNTDPNVPWITNYIETALLRAVWYPSTVATLSRVAKRIIKGYLDKTSDDPEGQIGFKLHDFGARGCTSAEQAGIGGTAHLVNFMGTDTVEALVYANRYYGEKMAGFSIPAAEHSTIMAWEHEAHAFNNMIDKFGGPGKLYAVVSDTYDIQNAVNFIWGHQLVNKVKAMGGTLVVRPDSGNPVVMTEMVIESLAEKFGYTVNSKGFKVLDPSVRVIQGDGVNIRSIDDILLNLHSKGYSADNIAFGMGAGLLQKVDRDTFGYAMKASAICQNGIWRAIAKSPKSDEGKKSKAGRLGLFRNGDKIVTLSEIDEKFTATSENLLVPVYQNGDVLHTWSMKDVRENAKL